jgi:hypothetical protein
MLLWLAAPAGATAATTIRVSLSSAGEQANGDNGSNSISDDGRYVAFDSLATNLVAGDTNGADDVFLRDRTAGTTTRVSVSTRGTQGNCDSFPSDESISDDGRFVVFASCADNLARHDRNGAFDVFIRDTQAATTEPVSVSSTGRYGDGDSFVDAISGSGRYIVFTSFTDNLVPGDTNDAADVFVRDTVAGTTSRIDVASDGTQTDCDSFSGTISDDGRFIAYDSCADNLVPGDTNGRADVFMRDTVANTTTRLSVTTNGTQGNDDSFAATISGDGATVAFTSNATNLARAANANGHKADIFVVSVTTGAIQVVSTNDDFHAGNKESCCSKALSDDGRFLVFRSFANNLVPGDTNHASDDFLADLSSGGISRVSVSSSGGQGNADAANAVISGDGRWALFASLASNLVPGDTNGVFDTFVRGPLF